MVTIVSIKTKYITPLSQFHHPLYLLHPPDLSSSRAFSSPPSLLSSFIVLIIIICYLHIIMMMKLMNLHSLVCYSCCAYFFSVDNLSIRAGPTFNSIYTVCKSFFRILWPIKVKQLINIKRLACYCGYTCFVFVCFYWQLDSELGQLPIFLILFVLFVCLFLRYFDLLKINNW